MNGLTELVIVVVTWIDSCFYDGPFNLEDCDDDGPGPASIMTSVGMLITETDSHITIALDYSQNSKSIRRAICIPRICIKRLEKFNSLKLIACHWEPEQ